MPNYFDQFDAPETNRGGNFFDQFDEAPSAAWKPEVVSSVQSSAPVASFKAATPQEDAALNWLAGGTVAQPIPAQVQPVEKPKFEDLLPNGYEGNTPQLRTMSNFLGLMPHLRAAELARSRGEGSFLWNLFNAGTPQHEAERKALQEGYNAEYEAAPDYAKVVQNIGLPGGPMAQASKALTSATRPIASGAAVGGTMAGVGGYFAPVEPSMSDYGARLESAAESIPLGVLMGGAAGTAAHAVNFPKTLSDIDARARAYIRDNPTGEVDAGNIFAWTIPEPGPKQITSPLREVTEAEIRQAAARQTARESGLYDWDNTTPYVNREVVNDAPRRDLYPDGVVPEVPTETQAQPKAPLPAQPVKPAQDAFDLLAPRQPATQSQAAEAPIAPAVAQGAVTPATAAPVGSGAVSEVGQPQQIVTPDGTMRVEAVPQIVELSDLKYASGELQPRDRSRTESQMGVNDRARNLDPSRLQPAPVSDSGAPIIAPDGTILSGNGRTMSIEKVYRDPRYMSSAGDYRASLGPAAEGFREPVLVMRLPDMPLEQQKRFADLSNRSSIAEMSSTERAVRDVQSLGLDAFSEYQGGDVMASHNNAFFKNFMRNAVTETERGALSKDGVLTKEGHDRLNAALMAAAYKDPGALSLMLESTEDNVRAITNAMKENAGRFAKLRAGVDAGVINPAVDASGSLTSAVQLISYLRSKGMPIGNYLAQQDAFNPIDPAVEGWLRAFYKEDLSRPVSKQKMAEVLQSYADEAVKHHVGGFIEDPTTAVDIINAAIAKQRGAEQPALFGDNGTSLAPSGGEAQRSAIAPGGGLGEGEIGQPSTATAAEQRPVQPSSVPPPAERITREEAAKSYPLSLGEDVKPPLKGRRGKYPDLAEVPQEKKGGKPDDYDFLHYAAANLIPVQFMFGGKLRIGTIHRFGLVSESPGSATRVHLYQTGGEVGEGKDGVRALKEGEGRWGHFNLEPTGVIPRDQKKRGATVDPAKQITDLGYAPLGTPVTIPKNAHNIQSGIKEIHVQIPYAEDEVHGGKMFALSGWHGTPHDFAPEPGHPAGRFRMDKIGTGEGAQVYSHGLYFGGVESTGGAYQKNLSSTRIRFADGKTRDLDNLKDLQFLPDDVWSAMKEAGSDQPIPAEAAKYTRAHTLSELVTDAMKTMVGGKVPVAEAAKGYLLKKAEPSRLVAGGVPKSAAEGVAKVYRDAAEALDKTGIQQEKGRLYKVSIDVEPEDLLDWDKPLSAQSPKVKAAIEELGYTPDDMSVKDLLMQFDSPESASEALRDFGIPGLRYLDGNSRASGEGTHNYVIYDDSLVKITAKDGNPITDAEKSDVLRSYARRTIASDDDARPLAVAQVSAGREVAAPKEILSLAHEAMRPFVPAIPQDVQFGALQSLKQGKLPGEIVATMQHPDGSTFAISVDSDTVFGARAFFDHDTRSLVSFRLGALSGDLGGDGVSSNSGKGNPALRTLSAEIAHELVHAVWRDLPGSVKKALVDHSNSLGILDMSWGDYLKTIGDPSWKYAPEGVSVRDVYERTYADLPDRLREDAMRQEAATHVMELYKHGALPEKQVAPVKQVLDGVLSGDYAGRETKGVPQTETAAFKRWFSGSKVVDENGAPLVVYHGTNTKGPNGEAIETFAPHRPEDVYRLDGKEIKVADSWDMGDDRKGMPEGYHYGAVSDARVMGADKALAFRESESKKWGHSSPDTLRHISDLRRLAGHELTKTTEQRPSGDASYFTPDRSYSYIRDIGNREGGHVIPAYLSIKNPVYLNSAEIETAGRAWNVEKYKKQGYDGAIFAENKNDIAKAGWNGSPQIVAFYPERQVKSAIGNRGTFNPEDPRITYAARGAKPQAPKPIPPDQAKSFALLAPRQSSGNPFLDAIMGGR